MLRDLVIHLFEVQEDEDGVFALLDAVAECFEERKNMILTAVHENEACLGR